jgi:lipid-binding SYLF domain-containing protein
MKMHTLLAAAGMALAFVTTPALAADKTKAEKQAEVRKNANEALEKFYKTDPKVKDEVAKAPGYAVFTSYGLSFVIGGAGGSGLAHDKATKKDTYMNMAVASAGIQAGISQNEVLLVFKTQKALHRFIDKGWDVGAGGAASGGVDSKTAGGGQGENFVNDALYYTLTKNGLELGAAVAGTKFWKEKSLN